MKILLILLLTSIFSFGYTGTPGEGTLTTDGTSSDVAAALNAALTGDTVIIPANTYDWTEQMTATVAAGVTLQGAGMDQTIITDSVDINSSTRLADITVSDQGTFKMKGITWDGEESLTFAKDSGTVRFNVSGTGAGQILIEDCRFLSNAQTYAIIYLGPRAHGVMYDSRMDVNGVTGGAIYAHNGRGSNILGDQEWAEDTEFGDSTWWFYVEDCEIYGNASGDGSRITDLYSGSKIVVRFNTTYNASLTEIHSIGHSGNDRSGRATEVYANKMIFDDPAPTEGSGPNYVATSSESGTHVIWGNDFDTTAVKGFYYFRTVRGVTSPYTQSPTPTGWGYAGTVVNGTGSNWDGGTYNGTDTTYGYPAIDQAGRGKGDLLTGVHPNRVNDTTGTIAWPNQALEPVYIWNNIGSIVSGWGFTETLINQDANRIQANRDYYLGEDGVQTSPTSPFDGTSGVGWGTLANRPTTATTGVAYWATDQGTWNTTESNDTGLQMNGADGVLYVATATDTWTLYYEPEQYPHPLRDTGEHTAASASQADVQAAVDAASNGDTVLIPSGTATWTSGISTTKQIIIRAETLNSTDEGRTDQSVVITNNATSEPLFDFTSGDTAHCGLAGIRIVEGTSERPHLELNGNGSKVPLIWDCSMTWNARFGTSTTNGAIVTTGEGGVFWNC